MIQIRRTALHTFGFALALSALAGCSQAMPDEASHEGTSEAAATSFKGSRIFTNRSKSFMRLTIRANSQKALSQVAADGKAIGGEALSNEFKIFL